MEKEIINSNLMNNSNQVKSTRAKTIRKDERVNYLKTTLEPKYFPLLSNRAQQKYRFKTDEQKFTILRTIERKCKKELQQIAETVSVSRSDIMSHLINKRYEIEYLDTDLDTLCNWYAALTYYQEECGEWIKLIIEDDCQKLIKEKQQILNNMGL